MGTTFWDRYKVFIIGLAGAIALSCRELLAGNANPNYSVFLYAALMAALSYVATQWRGKNATILGVIGTLAGVFVSLQQSGTFTWNQFIMYGLTAVIAALASPPKPATYEHDQQIIKAKEVPPIEPVAEIPKVPIGTIDPNKPKT